MSPSQKDDELERFEEYLRQKAAAKVEKTQATLKVETATPKSDFAKTLEHLKDHDTGEYRTDPDWQKFQQFLRHEAAAENDNNDSGRGEQSRLPHNLEGLNWGACILSVIWGGVMKVQGMTLLGWTFLMMVPIVGMIFPFYLLIKGNEIAWKSRRWATHDEFKETQRKWTRIGFALAVVLIAFVLGLSVWIYSLIGSLLRA